MDYLSLVAGLLLLIFSGNFLVKGSVQVSRHFRLSTLVVGLTVVAFGTSAPEIFVSVKAAFNGVPDLAIGNVVGSNIANIGLILGLVAVIMPISIVNKGVFRDWFVMLVASCSLIYVVWNEKIGFYEGAVFIALLIAYVIWSVFRSKRDKKLQNEVELPTISLFKSILYVVISIIGLYFGADLFVEGARNIALAWGVSDRVIGVTLVAFGTSLPELTTSLVAMVRKESDISVGNIIGSNIFNIWAVLGAASLLTPLPVVDFHLIMVDIIVSIIFSLILIVVMIRFQKGVITRWKGGVMFVLYIAYIIFVFI